RQRHRLAVRHHPAPPLRPRRIVASLDLSEAREQELVPAVLRQLDGEPRQENDAVGVELTDRAQKLPRLGSLSAERTIPSSLETRCIDLVSLPRPLLQGTIEARVGAIARSRMVDTS